MWGRGHGVTSLSDLLRVSRWHQLEGTSGCRTRNMISLGIIMYENARFIYLLIESAGNAGSF